MGLTKAELEEINQALQVEIRMLRAEQMRLLTENEQLRERNEQLLTHIRQQEEWSTHMRQQYEKLRDYVTSLRAYVSATR